MRVAPELEERVRAMAKQRERDPEEVLNALLTAALDEESAIEREIDVGLAQLNRGQAVPHADVMRDVTDLLSRYPRT